MNIQKSLSQAFLKKKDYLLQNNINCFRLVSLEESNQKNLWIDCYTDVAYVVLLKPLSPQEQCLLVQNLLEIKLSPLPKIKEVFIFLHLKNKTELIFGSALKMREASEWGYQFELELGKQIHTGIFLDQRENRKEVLSSAANKKILNLFCYTGLFSLAALAGDASEVHSVDLSKPILKRLEKNISLNSFKGKHFLYSEDVFEFLKKQIRKNNFYDLIILDPPSFSRSKNKILQIEKQFEELLTLSLQVLHPKGPLFFSINTQNLSYENFKRRVENCVRNLGRKILKPGKIPIDCYEGKKENFYLKSFWIG